jgi:hypothetical protein
MCAYQFTCIYSFLVHSWWQICSFCLCVTTLTLGSWSRQGLAKVRGKNEARESHFMLLGVWESLREWTSTLPNELSLWELESQWTPKISENNFRGQNPLDWKVPYIIEMFLEWRCLKWTHMTIWVLKTQVMIKRRDGS